MIVCTASKLFLPLPCILAKIGFYFCLRKGCIKFNSDKLLISLKPTIFKLWVCFAFVFLLGLPVLAQRTDAVRHTVEKGQTLYALSRIYKVSVADIVTANPSMNKDSKLSLGQVVVIPVQKQAPSKYAFYTVKPKDTLYRLSKRYKTTEDMLYKLNPGLHSSSLQIGQVIRVPKQEVHKVSEEETMIMLSNERREQMAALKAQDEAARRLEDLRKKKSIPMPANHLKVGVMLPFMLENGQYRSALAQRMREYYEGLLLAVDSLRNEGTSIELYAYDTGGSDQLIDDILVKPEMRDLDVLFGPYYANHIDMAADYTQARHITMVVPFSSKDDKVFNMTQIFQVNTPQSYLYAEVYDHFKTIFHDQHVIFIDSPNDEVAMERKKGFITGLKAACAEANIRVTQCAPEEEALLAALDSTGRRNIIIPTSGSKIALATVAPLAVALHRQDPKLKISTFGYPEWQTYMQQFMDTFFELDTYFYSSFYTNNLLPGPRNFQKNFVTVYGHALAQTYPKFGMLGFDTGYFFMKGKSMYRGDFQTKCNETPFHEIQTGFKFQRVTNWGGMINKRIFFIHCTPKFEVLKMDFDN